MPVGTNTGWTTLLCSVIARHRLRRLDCLDKALAGVAELPPAHSPMRHGRLTFTARVGRVARHARTAAAYCARALFGPVAKVDYPAGRRDHPVAG